MTMYVVMLSVKEIEEHARRYGEEATTAQHSKL